MPISGDARSRLPGPRLEPETASRQVIPEMVEIGDHLQELADDDGAPCWIIPQVTRISIDQRLIDAAKVEPPKLLSREREEPARAVECLSDARRRQLGAQTWNIDVEAGIEIGAHRCLHIGMFEHVEMHGDMAAPGVLAEDGGAEIPARVADARQIFAGVSCLERHGRQHGAIVEGGRLGMGRHGHARASGGR